LLVQFRPFHLRNHARMSSWNQPGLSNGCNISYLTKQRENLNKKTHPIAFILVENSLCIFSIVLSHVIILRT